MSRKSVGEKMPSQRLGLHSSKNELLLKQCWVTLQGKNELGEVHALEEFIK